MKPPTSIITLSLLATASAAVFAAQPKEAPAPGQGDMLRFTNNDTLHGSFLQFNSKDNLKWQNPESPDPITFATKQLHRITLNEGRAYKPMQYRSAVHLINGDVIPGKIISTDHKSVVLDTEHLGNITISREHVSQLSLTPFGGKLLYYGPLNKDGWKTISSDVAKNAAKPGDNPAQDTPDKANDPAGDKPKTETHWKFITNAWYSGSKKSDYLVLEDSLPDQCKISFKAGWRNSLYTTIYLHADFAPPEYTDKEKTGKEKNYSAANSISGHTYQLHLNGHSATLTSVSFDENGKAIINRFNNTRASLRLSGQNEANFEIRLDKKNKSLLLFTDGNFRCKWNLGEQYDGKGKHLAFRNQHHSSSELRISDVAISHWNGMRDSAQSMTTKERDIILLNNGLDRFSGTFKHIKDNQTTFIGSFQNNLTIPTGDIREIHFATKNLKPIQDPPNDAVHFFVYPYGRITGTPVSSANGKTKLSTLLLGDIELDTHYINIIDFSQSNSLLDLWDDNF